MDNWLALFDGQTRYFLDINDSQVKPDVLRYPESNGSVRQKALTFC